MAIATSGRFLTSIDTVKLVTEDTNIELAQATPDAEVLRKFYPGTAGPPPLSVGFRAPLLNPVSGIDVVIFAHVRPGTTGDQLISELGDTNIHTGLLAADGQLSGALQVKMVDFRFEIAQPVPTVSEWGLIVLCLLVLIGATVVLGFRPIALAGASGASFALEPPRPLFDAYLFASCLGSILTLLAISLTLKIWIGGPVSATDVTGSLITALGFTYLVHLWLLLRRGGLQASRP